MEISLPSKVNTVHREGNLAVFEIENLSPGYGITLGNALRRVLLSSLPGAAVTAMSIANVDHEFTTIPGVIEDTITIMLNVKQIRFRIDGEGPYTVRLKAKGERRVTAGDLEAPSQASVINKDAPLARLSSKQSALEMELTIERGIGYVPAEMRKREKLPIGTIAIDAIFTPVRRANFSVENMRVGERTDYNRLRFTIETDGSLTSEEAMVAAAKILVDQFSELLTLTPPPAETFGGGGKEGKGSAQEGGAVDAAKKKIDDLAISTRLKNALSGGGVKTVSGLLRKKRADILAFEGMGEKGIEELEAALKELGLALKE